MCSINENEKLISAMSDENCGLFEFTNEGNSVEVGFLCWIQTTPCTEDKINNQDLISEKTEIVLFWPSNIDVTYASSMVKRCKKKDMQWIKVSAILLAQGNWIEMCEKRKYYIAHNKISPCRSKRHERHIILSESTVTDKNKMVTTSINASAKRKYAVLSSSSVLKKLNCKKGAVEPCGSNFEDHVDKLEPQEDVVYSSDDENLSFPLSKLSKDDLIIKVKMLIVQNKDLRSTIAKQRVMIDISESFPRIHELSNLVLKNLESITEKQKISISASASPLKARTNISSISMVSKVTSKNVVKDVSKVDNVDFCNQVQPELLSNQPYNILEDFNGIQKTIVIEKDSVVEVSKEIVDKPNQSTIDKIANPKVMEIVKKVASSAMDQSEVSSENWVELWPKSGIEVNSFALSSINRKCPSKMISDLMIILFTDDELRNGSVTGKKSNFIKSGELKKQLDVHKVKAMKDFTQDIFRDVTDEIINKAIRTKLNNFSKKPKALNFNAGSATRLTNTI